jgi:hypothetical protein
LPSTPSLVTKIRPPPLLATPPQPAMPPQPASLGNWLSNSNWQCHHCRYLHGEYQHQSTHFAQHPLHWPSQEPCLLTQTK